MAITTQTTRLSIVSRTTRLRAALRRIDPYELVIVGGLLLAVLIGTVADRLQPHPAVGEPTARAEPIVAFRDRAVERIIVVTATPALPTPVPAPASDMTYTISSAPEQPTVVGYIAHTTDGDQFVPDSATPVPAGATYTGPFLAPALAEQAPPAAPRLCTGFGDWRDYDPMYASSPTCHP